MLYCISLLGDYIMSKKQIIDELLKRRDTLWKELFREPCVIRGSLIQTLRPPIHKKGKKPKRYPLRFLSRSIEGHNKITYVSKEQVGGFQKAIKNYHKCQHLLEQICELNIKIVKKAEEI